MKSTIKPLHQVKDNEVFQFTKQSPSGLGGKMIRLRGNKHNVLCLTSYHLSVVDYNEEVKIIGKLKCELFSNEQLNSRFDDLFGAAVENLREYYDELNDSSIVAGIKDRIDLVDTGNDQQDYENIRNFVEFFVQNWIVEGHF